MAVAVAVAVAAKRRRAAAVPWVRVRRHCTRHRAKRADGRSVCGRSPSQVCGGNYPRLRPCLVRTRRCDGWTGCRCCDGGLFRFKWGCEDVSTSTFLCLCACVCGVCGSGAVRVCVCAVDVHPHEPAVCGGRGLHRRSQTYWSTVTHRHAGLATPRIAQLCSRPAVSGTTCQQASATLPSPPPPLLRHLNHPHHHRHHGEGELSNQPTS